jgi:DNA mismatch endonuclease (patch repair protein)
MADVFTTRKRSEIMSRVRSKGNQSTEIRLLSLLRKTRIKGWRRNWPLFGRPDLVFPRQRVAIFVDGCFWHSCPLHRTKPQTNKQFWERKLARNVARDSLVKRRLKASG